VSGASWAEFVNGTTAAAALRFRSRGTEVLRASLIMALLTILLLSGFPGPKEWSVPPAPGGSQAPAQAGAATQWIRETARASHLGRALASSAPAPASVAYTLTAANGTLVQGNFGPPTPGGIAGAIYDPVDNQVFVGDSAGYAVYGIDGSTGRFRQAVSVGGGDPIGLGFLTNPTRIITADSSSGQFSVVDPSTGSIIAKVRIGGAPWAIATDANNNTIYVVDLYNDKVIALNATTYAVTANISVGSYPDAAAFDPADNLLYVANRVDSTLTVIDTKTNRVIGSPIQVGTGEPYCLVYDPRNGFIYSGNAGAGNVSIIDGATGAFVSPGVKVAGDCLAMVYDPANGNIYVGNAGAGIAAINGTSLNSTGGIVDPNVPEGLAFDSRDNLVYAANYGTNTVTAFNASTGQLTVVDHALSDTFLRATYDPGNGDIYVATPDPGFLCLTPGSVTVIHADAHPRVVASIPVGYGPEASVLDPKSGLVFVANYCSNNVTIINGSSQRSIGPGVPVGVAPIALGYDPVRDRIIVANGGSRNLTILNGSSGATLAANVSVGPQPDGVAVNPTNGWIYVADYGSGNLTVLNGTTYSRARSDIPVGGCPEGVIYDPKGGRIVSINSCTGNLTILNGTTGGYVNSSVPAGVGPVAAALDSTRNLLYVADAAGGTVAVVNLTTFDLQSPKISVNGDPQGIAYIAATDQVEVSDFLSGTISIIATVPLLSSLRAYPGTAEEGRPTQLVASATELGNAPLSLAYSGLPSGCLTANVSTLSCTPNQPGTFLVVATATDLRGYSGWTAFSLAVLPALGNASLAISPNRLDLGGTASLAVSIAGGASNLTFAYSGLPAGCLSRNLSLLSCKPSITGSFTILVLVTDQYGATVSAADSLNVAPTLSIESVVTSPPSVVVGEYAIVTVLVSGGTTPYSYEYQGLPAGCPTVNQSQVVCLTTAAGSDTIQARVTDSVGATVSTSTTLVVRSITALALTLQAFRTFPSTVAVGSNATLVAIISGGTGSYTFAYSGLPTGCSSTNTSNLSCRPTQLGSFNVSVRVTDTAHDEVLGFSSLHVVPASSARHAVPPLILQGVLVGGVLGGIVGGVAGLLVGRRPPRHAAGTVPKSPLPTEAG
jgi:YVTN family beta-propeller protein